MKRRKRDSEIAQLTEAEKEILLRGREDPSIITEYFFRPLEGGPGWKFDDNFDPEGAWQKDVCMASQTDIICVGGFGTGKTMGIAISACVWGVITHPDFKFMNAAPTAKQARYMYDYIMTAARGTRFEDLIFSAPETPYPKVELRFWFDETLVISTLEFASLDKNANIIYGWEGDWLNLDEAFLNDNLEEILTVTGSRVRGKIQGRTRLGRLSMITNSHDNMYGWYLAELAASDPENYLTRIVSSRHNHNVTPEQLARMVARIPAAERERFIEGTRPSGRGIYFSNERIYACESESYGDLIISGCNEGIEGFSFERVQGAGAIYFTVPPQPGHAYILLGDPGTANAPNRDSPVLMVFDVTDFPRADARMVAFWWGFGYGSITPFVGMLLRFMLMYRPIFQAVDNTGPQKNTAELMNFYLKSSRIEESEILRWLGPEVEVGKGVRIPEGAVIEGLDFSGGKKSAYLVAGRILIEAEKLVWPKFLVGLRSQLSNYDPLKDRAGQPKIPQDLVSTICMVAYAIQVYFAYDPAEQLRDDSEMDVIAINANSREARRNESRDVRSTASRA
jgi:hypothetical protein